MLAPHPRPSIPQALRAWLTETVGGVGSVELSSRLVDSPAIVVGHESAAMRRMMGMLEAGRSPELPPQKLEINASHPIIRGLASARETQPALAKMIAHQLFDNALISAGILDDPRAMIGNLNSIMQEALEPSAKVAPPGGVGGAAGAADRPDDARPGPSQ